MTKDEINAAGADQVGSCRDYCEHEMSESPNRKHRAELKNEGEIGFGPPFFTLKIDGRKLRGRIFGGPLLWSDDSRYLAAAEWLTLDYQKGPITRVLLIDVEAKMVSEFKRVDKGYVEKFRFAGGTFLYLKNFMGTGHGIESEVDLSAIHNWKRMRWWKRRCW